MEHYLFLKNFVPDCKCSTMYEWHLRLASVGSKTNISLHAPGS